MPSNDTRLLRCIAKGAALPTKVLISVNADVDDLKLMVYKKYKRSTLHGADITELLVWQLKNPEPIIPEGSLHSRVLTQGPLSTIAVNLESISKIGDIFKDQPELENLHIVVQRVTSPTISPSSSHTSNLSISTHAPLKRCRSLSPQGFGEVKKRRISYPRKWTVTGGIRAAEIGGAYFVDPETQDVTTQCLSAVSAGSYMLLAGARASGKSTRLFWLREKLEKMGYYVFYISIDTLSISYGAERFWESFANAILAADGRKFPTPPISSTIKLTSYFGPAYWDEKRVVLLIDEFSLLYRAGDDVRNEFLGALRGLKHNSRDNVMQCVIAAGTFDIVHLNPREASPFNIAECAQSPYFTIDETRKLFDDFSSDLTISIGNDIADDIWAKSNGHPGMVCLCGRAIYRNMKKLVTDSPQSRTISYLSWKSFSAEDLFHEISQYSTFYSMMESLQRAELSSSVDLLRSRFTGFLGDVILTDGREIRDADTLTSEGVLLKPDPFLARYRMASPLVDGLIRNQVIPNIFPDAPSSPPPRQNTGHVDVLGLLTESLKFFDKALILNASFCSYKNSKVKISTSHGFDVPRESVYDTELIRILANWLRKLSWSVVGQWHLENNLRKRKYSDIVLKKDNHTIVLELLATGEPSIVESHIRKTPEYAELLSADEAWVVHFTRQEDHDPMWLSDVNVNVVHFAHDPGFTNVVMSTRWTDCAGEVHQEVGKRVL